MIAGIFHEGSGLGDQLFRYITVRTLAEEKGFKWGMMDWRYFKGDFIDLTRNGAIGGKLIGKWAGTYVPEFIEKDTRESGNDIRSYDPEINFVEDNTVIDGSFEDDKYWRHNLGNIDKWLAVEPLGVPDDLCVIGFRGGEYAAIPELFLPKEYYDTAIAKMREINPAMQFQVHTDDPTLAKQFFPDFEVVENERISHSKHTNMAFNWRSARFAKHAIIPNSAFFILPRILSKGYTIAPRYWAGRNQKIWKRPACYYPEFTYA